MFSVWPTGAFERMLIYRTVSYRICTAFSVITQRIFYFVIEIKS